MVSFTFASGIDSPCSLVSSGRPPKGKIVSEQSSVDVVTVDEETKTVDLYDANKGKVARTGGPYLDEIEAEKAEERRAKLEDREPDLENPPATVSTRLVPKSQLVERDTNLSHVSEFVEVENEPVTTIEVVTPKTEPDPTQVDFDNNYDNLNALRAGQELAQLKRDVEPKKEESVSTEDDNV
jgi:hypothetical protein